MEAPQGWIEGMISTTEYLSSFPLKRDSTQAGQLSPITANHFAGRVDNTTESCFVLKTISTMCGWTSKLFNFLKRKWHCWALLYSEPTMSENVQFWSREVTRKGILKALSSAYHLKHIVPDRVPLYRFPWQDAQTIHKPQQYHWHWQDAQTIHNSVYRSCHPNHTTDTDKMHKPSTTLFIEAVTPTSQLHTVLDHLLSLNSTHKQHTKTQPANEIHLGQRRWQCLIHYFHFSYSFTRQ